MKSLFKELKPYLFDASAPIAEALTNHEAELWLYADYPKALLCGEKVEVDARPLRVHGGDAYIYAPVVEKYLGGTLKKKELDGVPFVSAAELKKSGLYIFYNYDIGVLVLSHTPMAYKNEDKPSLRDQILRLGDLIFSDPDEAQLLADIQKTHGKLAHPIFDKNTAGYALGTPFTNLGYELTGSYVSALIITAAIMLCVTLTMQMVITSAHNKRQ